MVRQPDPQDRIGGRVAQKYQLLRLLGSGGMGAVYEAEHVFTQRRVALKLMHSAIARSGAATQRFLRESRAPSAIGHPGIVQVLDGGVDDDGAPYVVLELLDGVSLHDAIESHSLDAQACVEIGIELLDALQAAHAAGFVHRDIKPENVFLARDARGETSVKLLDFGIAGVLVDDDNPKLTQTGAVLGTPLFMSPEQATGKRADHRSDLWSVGALLYNALAGQPPYSGDSYNALIVSIVTTDPIPLRHWKPDLPEALLAVVDRALRKEPAQRFQDAGEMRAALEAVTWAGEAQPEPRRDLPVVPSQRPAATEPQPFAVRSTPRIRGTQGAAELAARREPVPSETEPARGNAYVWVGLAALLLCSSAGALWWQHARPPAQAHAEPSVAAAVPPSAAAVTAREPAPAPTRQAPAAEPAPQAAPGSQLMAAESPAPHAPADGLLDASAPRAQSATAAPALPAERDPASLAQTLDEHQLQIQRCLEEAVMAQMQQGNVHAETYRLAVTLDVSPAGHVERADVVGQAPAELTQCVRKSAQGFVFPAAAKGSVFRFPLLLQPTIVGH